MFTFWVLETSKVQEVVRLRIHLTLVNSLNAELNRICHLLALLGIHHILHVSRIRVKEPMPLL